VILRERVAALWAVHGDVADRPVVLDQYVLVGHGSLLPGCHSAIPGAALAARSTDKRMLECTCHRSSICIPPALLYPTRAAVADAAVVVRPTTISRGGIPDQQF